MNSNPDFNNDHTEEYDEGNLEKYTAKEKNGKKKKYSKGFYIALSFCLLAMAAAAWTTYSSVEDYMQPDPLGEYTTEATQAEKQAGANVSGVTVPQSTDPTVPAIAQQAPTESPTLNTQPTEDTTAPTEQATAAKNKVYPVGQEITKDYSGDTPVYSKTLKDWRLHRGTDYAASVGDTVNPIDDGTVLEIKKDSLLGTTVTVEHNSGFTAYYCGVEPGENITEGAHVCVGDVLGTVAEIPGESKDEPHLHLEIKIDGKTVNPSEVLNNATGD